MTEEEQDLHWDPIAPKCQKWSPHAQFGSDGSAVPEAEVQPSDNNLVQVLDSWRVASAA